jgi:hypothetical protein
MTGQVPVWNLCKRAPRRRSDSILCRDCADAISRVMSSDIYEANHYQSRPRKVAQTRLLAHAATASNRKHVGSTQAQLPEVGFRFLARAFEARRHIGSRYLYPGWAKTVIA